jgi:hypothetical protein
MGFVLFALMLAAIEVSAAFSTPAETPMPPWMRLLLPVSVAVSAYRYPRTERGAVVVLGVVLFLTLNRGVSALALLFMSSCWRGAVTSP